jgi:2-oxoglutarate ferredoxin oxidoreductase subunit alpha
MTRELLEGNFAIAEAAVRAGCEAYFGYPITPQTEVLEWMSHRMPELGRAFLQAESEVAAINMVYGAACAGAKVMSSSSSPGVSLMMEGMSYIAGTEVPCVLVDVVRGGPGLGNIAPSQGDYNQIVHGGGHGDYHPIDLAEKYRAIAIVMADGSIGQMMEPAELPEMRPLRKVKPDWAVTGAEGREPRSLSSIYLIPEQEEIANLRLAERWYQIAQNEVRYKEYFLDDAEIVIVGFGTAGRVSLSAVRAAREEGVKVGLFRPISLNPFPFTKITELSKRASAFLVVEMNTGQMLDDVRLAVENRVPIDFYGRPGGTVPYPDEVLGEIRRMARQPSTPGGDPRLRWLQRLNLVMN